MEVDTCICPHTLSHTFKWIHRAMCVSHMYATQSHTYTPTLRTHLCHPFLHTCVCSTLLLSLYWSPGLTPGFLRALFLSEPPHYSLFSAVLREGTQRILVACVSSCSGCRNHDLKRKAETQCGHDTGHSHISPSLSPVTTFLKLFYVKPLVWAMPLAWLIGLNFFLWHTIIRIFYFECSYH